MATREHRCPVTLDGLELRRACERCEGRPPGQVVLQPGQLLVLQGEEAEHLHAVVEGLLEESLTLLDGREVALRLIGAGEVVGTEALGQAQYASTIRALTSARVCAVHRETVEATLDARPEQNAILRRRIESHAQALRERLVSATTQSAEERVYATLLQLGAGFARGAWFRPVLSRRQIGEYLGLAPETVTRALRRLEATGRVEIRGRSVRLCLPPS